MHYYLVRPLEGIREPEILNYNEVIPYKAFLENKPWKINSQTVCVFQNETDLECMLLSPLPLFSEELKQSLDLFWWAPEYREMIFLERTGKKRQLVYFLPFFPRITGSLQRQETEQGPKAVIFQKELIPEDYPAVYLENGEQLHVILRLDLVESLLRSGLCSVNLCPVKIEVSKDASERR